MNTSSAYNSKKIIRIARSGIVLAESAILLPVLFLALFAILDLGIASLRYNALAHASCRIARECTLHGSHTAGEISPWGPGEFQGTAADDAEVVASVKGLLPTMAPQEVSARVSWIEGDNSPRDLVRVELTYFHKPIVTSLLPWGELELRAVSTMRIIN